MDGRQNKRLRESRTSIEKAAQGSERQGTDEGRPPLPPRRSRKLSKRTAGSAVRRVGSHGRLPQSGGSSLSHPAPTPSASDSEGGDQNLTKRHRKHAVGAGEQHINKGEAGREEKHVLEIATGLGDKPIGEREAAVASGSSVGAALARKGSNGEVESLKEENERLLKELAFKDGVMSSQRDTISYFYGQCTCTICLDLVWRPHVLSPCGHVFCAHCLVSWFTKPDPSEGEGGPSHSADRSLYEIQRTQRRAKVCPHCRESVVVAPVEVWLVKGLVDRVDRSMKLGQGNEEHLSEGKESFAGLSPAAQQEAKGANLPSSKAIWKDIFAPDRREEPMFDEEDRVHRCGFCASEVLNGACTNAQCGMVYNMHGHTSGSDTSFQLFHDHMLDSFDESDEFYDEYFEGTDEDDLAFIDDDSADVPVWRVERRLGAGQDRDGNSQDPIEVPSESSSDDGILEVDVRGRPVRSGNAIRANTSSGRRAIVDSDDESDRRDASHISIGESEDDGREDEVDEGDEGEFYAGREVDEGDEGEDHGGHVVDDDEEDHAGHAYEDLSEDYDEEDGGLDDQYDQQTDEQGYSDANEFSD